MSADVIPFIAPTVRAEMDHMIERLGKCEDALIKAADIIKDLQWQLENEKIVKAFYQNLATERLLDLINTESKK